MTSDNLEPLTPADVAWLERMEAMIRSGKRDSVNVERVLERHTPWARVVFAEQRLWLACYCGWNAKDDDDGAWNDHFLASAKDAPVFGRDYDADGPVPSSVQNYWNRLSDAVNCGCADPVCPKVHPVDVER